MNFTLSHFLIATQDGLLLPSLLYSHNSLEKPLHKELVVLIHGAGSSSIIRRPSLSNTLASTLADKDVDLLTFNNRGAGYITKFDTTSGKTITSGMTYELITESSYDISAVVSWATEERYEKIHLVGHSTGANKVVIWATQEPNQLNSIASLVLVGGGDDVSLQRQRYSDHGLITTEKLLAQKNTDQQMAMSLVPDFPGDHPISQRSLRELLMPGSDYDIFPFARSEDSGSFKRFKAIQHPNIAAIYGANDFGTIVSPREAIERLSRENTLSSYIIPDADHNFTLRERELSQVVTDYIKAATR